MDQPSNPRFKLQLINHKKNVPSSEQPGAARIPIKGLIETKRQSKILRKMHFLSTLTFCLEILQSIKPEIPESKNDKNINPMKTFQSNQKL